MLAAHEVEPYLNIALELELRGLALRREEDVEVELVGVGVERYALDDLWQVCMTMHGKRRIGVGALRGPLGGFRNIDNLIALVMLRCSSLSITLPGRG